MPLRIGIIVGEISGDIIAANLINSLKEIYPDIEVEGIIGPHLIKSGCTQLFSMQEISVMGFVDPILNICSLLRIRNWITRYFLEDPPDLFIGVDAPDFNLSIEKKLKEAGIPTVHYVSPTVWAWRKGRIKTIKKACDLMLTLFPFEEKIYHEHNIPVKFVGHPAADKINLEIDVVAAKQKLNLPLNKTIVALFPGSRESELKYHVPLYIKVAKLCYQLNPDLYFVTSLVTKYHADHFRSYLEELAHELPITILSERSHDVMSACDVALVTSGTATLEVMMHKKPMVVAYKTNFLSYFIIKQLINVSFISLPNLLKNFALVPELIQNKANVKDLSEELLKLISSEKLQKKQTEEFYKLHKQLRKNAGKVAAKSIIDMLGLKNGSNIFGSRG